MASIGSANLTIVPKFDGLTASVNKALAGVDASAGGKRMGESLAGGVEKGTGGLARSGAIMGVFSTVTSKAMDAIASHVGSAASRLDTLKNYPVTMQALGYGAEASQASIQKMSDRLGSLPTRLDDMARTVQGLVSVTGDLGRATDVGLAMNDMFLASGASTQLATAAGEQFRQMLAKGKPDMQDWKSLVSAAPGQMDQLAKAMLGPTAGAKDLYAALGGGGADPTITMDQLMDEIVRLDTQGGSGITSFKEQAETASGGIQTSFENMGNAVTKGIANVMDAVGRDTISGALNDVKSGINDAFRGAADVARDLTPAIKGAWDVVKRLAGDLKPIAPLVAGIATAVVGLKAARGAFGAVSADMKVFGAAAGKASEWVLGLGEKMSGPLAEGALKGATGLSSVAGVLSGPWGVAIAAGVAGVTLLVGHFMEAQRKQDALTSAVDAFHSVTSHSKELESYRGSVDALGQSASDATFDIEDLTTKMQAHADAMQSNVDAAEGTIGTWQTVQSTIDALAGQTSLTADEQGRLKWALDQVNDATGESISLEEAMTGKYTDQSGEVQDLKSKVDDLAQSRIAAAKADAYSQNLTEAYKAQADAADALTSAQGEYNSRMDEYVQKFAGSKSAVDGHTVSLAEARDMARAAMGSEQELTSNLQAAQGAYDDANASVQEYSRLLGDAAAAEGGAADGAEAIKAAMGGLGGTFDQALVASGTSLSEFAQRCADAGISTDELRTVGEDNLTSLAQSCGGNVDQMVAALALYNSTPIIDKDGNVSVDATKLVDAEGNVYDWNGQELYDKEGNVAVDVSGLTDAAGNVVDWNGTELVNKQAYASADVAPLADAQGQLYVWNGTSLVTQDGHAVSDTVSLYDGQQQMWTWNGTSLVRQKGTADANDQGVRNAIDSINRYNSNPPKDHHATTTIDIVHNTFENIIRSVTGGHASGGIRTHADGGGRYHADGAAIATRAVPLDIVGEAGAEAIVPLTNRRYSQPFADVIADGVAARLGTPASVTSYNISGLTFNDVDLMHTTVYDFLTDLQRRAAMNVG